MTDDTTTPPSPAPASEPKTGSMKKGLVVSALAVVVAGGLAFACWQIWLDVKPKLDDLWASAMPVAAVPVGGAVSDMDRLRHDLAQSTQALDDTRARLSRLEAAAGTAAVAVPDKALEGRVAVLEKNAADATSVLRLVDRLDQIEGQLRDIQARRKGDVAQLLSIGLLRDALNNGRPYGAELRALQVLTPDDSAIAQGIAQLKPYSTSGIPMTPILVERFFIAEAAILRADALPEGDINSWTSRVLDRLFTLVSIHREDGEIAGAGPAAAIGRAHAALMHSDLAGAVHELEHLQGPAAQVAQPWIADAKARLSADQLVNEWSAQAVAAVGAKL